MKRQTEQEVGGEEGLVRRKDSERQTERQTQRERERTERERDEGETDRTKG